MGARRRRGQERGPWGCRGSQGLRGEGPMDSPTRHEAAGPVGTTRRGGGGTMTRESRLGTSGSAARNAGPCSTYRTACLRTSSRSPTRLCASRGRQSTRATSPRTRARPGGQSLGSPGGWRAIGDSRPTWDSRKCRTSMHRGPDQEARGSPRGPNLPIPVLTPHPRPTR